MNMSTLLTLLWLITGAAGMDDKPRMTRILYDVELASGDQKIMVDVVLNLLDEQHFSISCRKNPGGLLFTFWATPESNYAFFPKNNLAFQGSPEQAFGLFPGSPELDRSEWFLLLYRRTSGSVGPLEVAREDGWRVLTDEHSGFRLRWRETNRLFKTRYSTRVFEPRVENVTTHPIENMKKFWDAHAIEE